MSRVTLQDSRDIARCINQVNTRQALRVEVSLNVVMVVIVGIAAGLAMVAWASGCEAGHLCAVTAVVPTRTPWLRRWADTLHARYVRQLLRSALLDEAHLVDEMTSLPSQLAYTRSHITALRAQLHALTGRQP